MKPNPMTVDRQLALTLYRLGHATSFSELEAIEYKNNFPGRKIRVSTAFTRKTTFGKDNLMFDKGVC